MMYRIIDWAYNEPFPHLSFESFEDGWEFLWAAFPDEDDEFFSDYFVVTI